MKKLLCILAVLAAPLPAAAASPSPTPSAAVVPSPTGGEVRINEFLPNPEGSDTGNEWIELKNVSAGTRDAGGLKVKRESGTTVVTVPDGTVLAAGEIFLLNASGSMVNGGDTIGLWLDDTLIDQVTYDTAEDGVSWARLATGEGAWTDAPTPGEENPADVPTGGSGADGAASDPTTASTRSASGAVAGNTTVARKTAAAAAKRGPLPKSGPNGWLYVLPALLATLYAYKTGA